MVDKSLKKKNKIFLKYFVIASLLILGFSLIFDFVLTFIIHNEKTYLRWLWFGKDETWFNNWKLGVIILQFVYFTNQSNILLVWFYLLFLKKKKLSQNNHLKLALTLYITITMLMYYLFLFRNVKLETLKNFYGSKTIAILWLLDVTMLHLVTPIMFITFFIISANKLIELSRKNKLKLLSKISVYPILYFLFAFFNSRFLQHYSNGNSESKFNVWYIGIFDYFGKNNPEYPFIGWKLIAIFLTMGIIINSCFYLYIFLNNFYIKKNIKNLHKKKLKN